MRAYQFIDNYHNGFGVRWLLKRMKINPNSYYNYKKMRKFANKKEIEKLKEKIQEIYHEHHGVPGHRTMMYLLRNTGLNRSKNTIHKYMNQQLGLRSIVRHKKPEYKKGKAHKTFNNELQRQFHVKEKNKIWCTDFTYLFLSSGSKRYNFTIIDLYDRSVIASVNGKSITSELAIETIDFGSHLMEFFGMAE